MPLPKFSAILYIEIERETLENKDMNINPNFENEFDFAYESHGEYSNTNNPPADDLILMGMGFIYAKLIEPMEDKLSEKDTLALNLIGVTFLNIGKQARAMEEIEESLNQSQNQNISQN